nr:four-carbon acid sugar kinase family protein [Paenibacillus sp. OK003]
MATGYPKNNRTILNGTHYLNGVPLADTEIANDPKTPVTLSYLPDLLKLQTKYEVGQITVSDLESGNDRFPFFYWETVVLRTSVVNGYGLFVIIITYLKVKND